MPENIWLVTVFKVDPSKVREILIALYDYAKDIEEIKSLHFIIRDRFEDKIVFSFRFMLEEGKMKILASKISFKLKSLMSEKDFVIGPTPDHQLYKYEAWPWRKTLEERGPDKFNAFYTFLSRLSFIVVEMAKQDYFSSSERVETAHVFSWILGCNEITCLIPQEKNNSVLTGLLDRIENRFYTYNKQDYPKIET